MQKYIQKLVDGQDLSANEATDLMKDIMSGKATDAQISSVLTALRMKGETIEEITAFAKVMNEFASRIKPKSKGMVVDTCGTGGDKIKTFNVSTISAFVIAGAGITVAKHGNRSVTSKCGSADLLEKLGVNLNLKPKDVEKIINEIGIGFMFAPNFHPAMKYAIGPRKEIAIRTVFNVLGPLTNPAGADAQVLGVYSEDLVEKIAYVLKGLGRKRAMVVHGLDGLDEISTTGETLISELKDGKVKTYKITPEELGLKKVKIEDIAGTDVEKSAVLALNILNGELGVKREMVLANAAAGIIVGGKAGSFKEAIRIAKESIDSGKAHDKLKKLVEISGGDLSTFEKIVV